jgi:hypothetical protein
LPTSIFFTPPKELLVLERKSSNKTNIIKGEDIYRAMDGPTFSIDKNSIKKNWPSRGEIVWKPKNNNKGNFFLFYI